MLRADLEIEESNQAFIDTWRNVYPNLPGGEYRELPGLVTVWGNVTLPFCNAVLLSTPLKDRSDLERRVEVLQTFLAKKSRSPMFLVCQDWLPHDVRPVADEIIGRAGLMPAIPLFGMVAEGISPPDRRLSRLRYREVCDQETRNLISDINSAAYGFAFEYGREAFASAAAWQNENYAYLGCVDGEAVTTSAVGVLGRRLYVGFVATLPARQRRGYAEAVMRHALTQAQKATGLQRSLLHATKEGHPVYLRLGFRETARFMGYVRQ